MEISIRSYKKIVSTWWVLRIFYGIMPLIAGLDRLLALNKLAQWQDYLGNIIQQIIPLETVSLVRGIGVIEIVIGLLILAGLTRLGGWFFMVLSLLIAANLISMGLFYDVVMRQILIAAGSFALVKLTDVKDELES